MPFTDADKKQLWTLFSNDTDDLDDGSDFMRALRDFEAEDVDHPTFNLVADVQSCLAQITALEPQITAAQSSGGLRSVNVDDEIAVTYGSAANQVQGVAQQKSGLVEKIRQQLKLDDYIGNPKKSKVLGVMPMIGYNRYGYGYR